MLKAKCTIAGRETFLIGLSYGNLDRFREQPLDTFIRIDAAEHGLPFDIMIMSGRTEAELVHFASGRIGPETKVKIDPRLKS